jgi:RNA polymerase II elongation factor ELL
MPLLRVPDSGLSFESVTASKAPKNGSPPQDVIGLTLTDDLIEQMIQCVQNGKPIQLSLGTRPVIHSFLNGGGHCFEVQR